MACYKKQQDIVQVGWNGECDLVIGIRSPVMAHYSVSIYPNPSSGDFNLVFANAERHDMRIRVFNTLGARVQQTVTNSDHYALDLSAQPRGVYCVEISDGDRIAVKKVVKKN